MSHNVTTETINVLLCRDLCIETYNILKLSSNLSPYVFTLVQKVKHRIYKIHAF